MRFNVNDSVDILPNMDIKTAPIRLRTQEVLLVAFYAQIDERDPIEAHGTSGATEAKKDVVSTI